jgi:hypothetical protein
LWALKYTLGAYQIAQAGVQTARSIAVLHDRPDGLTGQHPWTPSRTSPRLSRRPRPMCPLCSAELRVAPEAHPVLRTELPLKPRAYRERMMPTIAEMRFSRLCPWTKNMRCRMPSFEWILRAGTSQSTYRRIYRERLSLHHYRTTGIVVAFWLKRFSASAHEQRFSAQVFQHLCRRSRDRGGFQEGPCCIALDIDTEMRAASVSSDVEKTYELQAHHHRQRRALSVSRGTLPPISFRRGGQRHL